ncbi:ubiquinone biosynthesis protein AarF [Rhodopirellula maiorica SM1]|uniref:Ubiquinone biosynthesis protein AarF n=2 Tax=Novipirellula TaxID=2795426 RepID=M5RK26_9BACT|nr:ubiquinone biosynthesis protein AarF [Rhodopirellula maiorica SM1]
MPATGEYYRSDSVFRQIGNVARRLRSSVFRFPPNRRKSSRLSLQHPAESAAHRLRCYDFVCAAAFFACLPNVTDHTQMDLIDVPQFVRNADRFREVVSVLAKHGLADWLSNIPIPWLNRIRGHHDDDELTTEQRIRVAMTELGTTFIKLGQVLSTRPDLVGNPLANELAQLRANTPADEANVVVAMIESELGATIDTLFAEFEPAAMASASIGQVHRATLHDGELVVVKVQHAGIERRIVNDLEIMTKLAEIAEQQSTRLRQYRPVHTMREFQRTLMKELNFDRELRNMEQFRRNFANDPTIRIAKAYPNLSSRRVLTMERFEGISLSDQSKLEASGIDLDEIARRGASVFVEMIFRDGFYHADPHPGNLMLLANQAAENAEPVEIGILDCGMVGRIDNELREHLELGLIAAVGQDAAKITDVVASVGEIPIGFDEPALMSSIQELIDEYAHQSLGEFDLSGFLHEIVEIIREHRIYLPAKVAMLLKVLVMLEGTAHQLSPSFCLAELIEPYGKRAMLRRFSPKKVYARLKSNVDDWERLISVLPKDAADILHNFKRGKFDVHLQHRRLEPIVNRLVLGILTAALFMGSASLCSSLVPPLLLGISVPGFIGCAVAVVMGYGITRSIRRSHRVGEDD